MSGFLKWNLKVTDSKSKQQLKHSFGGGKLLVIELHNIHFIDQILS